MVARYLFHHRVRTRDTQKMRERYVHANNFQREKKRSALLVSRVESIISSPVSVHQLPVDNLHRIQLSSSSNNFISEKKNENLIFRQICNKKVTILDRIYFMILCFYI